MYHGIVINNRADVSRSRAGHSPEGRAFYPLSGDLKAVPPGFYHTQKSRVGNQPSVRMRLGEGSILLTRGNIHLRCYQRTTTDPRKKTTNQSSQLCIALGIIITTSVCTLSIDPVATSW